MVHDVGAARLVDFVGAFAFNVVLEQVNHRAARGAQRESHVRQLPGHVKHPFLVPVIHGDEDFAFRRQGIECTDLGFCESDIRVRINAHHLSGGFHFRPQHHVDAREAAPWENGFLHAIVFRSDFPGKAQFRQRFAGHDLCGQLGEGLADGFGDERNGAGGAGIHLNDVKLFVFYGKLDVHQPADVQFACQFLGSPRDFLVHFHGNSHGGNHAGGIP